MEEADIRGEYWIMDGSVQFADGDVGDVGHEGIAIDHVFNEFGDAIHKAAQDLGVEVPRYGDNDPETIGQLLAQLGELDPPPNVQQLIDANKPAWAILNGGGNASLYVMMYEGWIAVRENNAELYGYDAAKQKSLANGLDEIVQDEGLGDDIAPENVEISIYDHKTNKSWYATLADLENSPQARAPTPLTTASKKSFPAKPEDNTPSAKSIPNPWNQAAQQAGAVGPGQQLWRGTSESKYPTFEEWLKNNYIDWLNLIRES